MWTLFLVITPKKTKDRIMSLSCPLVFSLLFSFGELVLVQIKYWTQEEIKVGSIVGNVAEDLDHGVSTLMNRRFCIVSGAQDALFEVNTNVEFCMFIRISTENSCVIEMLFV